MVRRGAAMAVDVASSGGNIQVLVERDDRSGDDVGGEDGRGWYDEASERVAKSARCGQARWVISPDWRR